MPSLLGLSMAQEQEENNLEAKFDAAVKVIWSLPEEGDNLSLLPSLSGRNWAEVLIHTYFIIMCLLVCNHRSR